MKIVIDIPEKYYNAILKIPVEQLTGDTVLIRYGQPLPKKHGRLIDANNALDYFTTNMNWVDEDDNRIDSSEERKAIFKDYFDRVPTIIEASESEEV